MVARTREEHFLRCGRHDSATRQRHRFGKLPFDILGTSGGLEGSQVRNLEYSPLMNRPLHRSCNPARKCSFIWACENQRKLALKQSVVGSCTQKYMRFMEDMTRSPANT